jgi:GT2 family glycosyltransferase
MIYLFTPYSFEKKLFEAYDQCFNLINDDDWACFLDGDTMFLESNFGHLIAEYIELYPDTGLFTCYSSRSAYQYLVPSRVDQKRDSIIYHREISRSLVMEYHGSVVDICENISGHLMLIKKSVWMSIRDRLIHTCAGANLLGVDTQIGKAILSSGLKIRLMQGIYLMHYYRLAEGKKYKEHLMDHTVNILIRTSQRPESFKRCIESCTNQTYKNINILISADTPDTVEYVRNYGFEAVQVKRRYKNEIETYPFNAYLNELMDKVTGGWIFILDDDDYLADNSIIEKLVRHLTDDNVLYFFRMRWPNNRVIPSDCNFYAEKIVRKDIGMPCFMFHAKHKHKVRFKPIKQGDFYFISDLAEVLKKRKWIDSIVTQIGNTGANGKPEKQ